MDCRYSTTSPPIQSRYGSLPSFALWPAFPTSDYYEGSAPPVRRPSTGLS